jgi:hypothetical protein
VTMLSEEMMTVSYNVFLTAISRSMKRKKVDDDCSSPSFLLSCSLFLDLVVCTGRRQL